MQESTSQPAISSPSDITGHSDKKPEVKKGIILVIDDEVGPRESIRMLFKDTHTVLLAASGDEGLEVAKKTHLDVVILDLRMPGKSGLETLEELRRINEKVPVIILTGYGTMETAKKAMHLGAVEFLSKPFDVEEMERYVASALHKSRSYMASESLMKRLTELNSLLQEKLQGMEKLATVGQLSAEILHEINNPLTVIRGYNQLLMQELSASADQSLAERQKYLVAIEEEIRRCQALARSVLNLSRPSLEKKPVDINAILTKMVEFLQHSRMGRRVRFRLTLEHKLPAVPGDSNQLHQAFTNILINSIQALPPNGEIRISTSRVANGIQTTLSDNGHGISEADLPRIFEPFFSTKKEGTGLGLAITNRIIQQHGGTIAVESAPGKGTSFQVFLPTPAV